MKSHFERCAIASMLALSMLCFTGSAIAQNDKAGFPGQGQTGGFPGQGEQGASPAQADRPGAGGPTVHGGPPCDCPKPIYMTLNANTPNLFQADFSPASFSAQRVGLNSTATNKFFLHTFQWKSAARNCQITSAVLTVKMKSNNGGSSAAASDAGNDTISVVVNGAGVPPFSERVYSAVNTPFSAGQAATKVWNLTGAALTAINANSRLSFSVQDDTMVQSATLVLRGCCLTN